MKRKGFIKIFTPYLAIIFALNCLFPAHIALALKDCGSHKIVSCGEHNDEHFVASHTSNKTNYEKGSPRNIINSSGSPAEEHDAAHQIDKGKLEILTASAISPEGVKILCSSQASQTVSAFSLQVSNWPNSPPIVMNLLTNSFLYFLPSIRLQI